MNICYLLFFLSFFSSTMMTLKILVLTRKMIPCFRTGFISKYGYKRFMASAALPHHLLVGMPALSPTMESGSIASWRVAEGDSFIAGDALAEIQTDKATMAFEAQDAGFVAKLLVTAGDGTDIKIGSPIMVTVEEQEYVQAFKDFVPPTVPVAKLVDASTPSVHVATDVKSVQSSIPSPAAGFTAETIEEINVPPQTITTPSVAMTTTNSAVSLPGRSPITVGPAWGNLYRVNSPLAKILSGEQKKYIERFGSTGQVPQ